MVLCNDCMKEIKENKVQISKFLIVDLCKVCVMKYPVETLKLFDFNENTISDVVRNKKGNIKKFVNERPMKDAE